MLWEAGQQRIEREGRDRLAELYVGVRDGYVAGNVATGKVVPRGDAHIPYYVRPDAEQRQVTTKRGLGQILADFPVYVATGREFTN